MPVERVDQCPESLSGLVAYPREQLDTELKGWLDLSSEEHKASLAQAILALANSSGGWVVIGFSGQAGAWKPDGERPASLAAYTQDAVNGIVQNYAEPPFHCELYLVTHPETGEEFPVIRVPGDHKVPIRARRDGPERRHVVQNAYYIRRPGPCSEPVRTGREWDKLIGRCVVAARDDLLEKLSTLLRGGGVSGETPSREEQARGRLREWDEESIRRWHEVVPAEATSLYQHGVWSASYVLMSEFAIPALAELRDILERAKGHETGWPCWLVPGRHEVYAYEDAIECWIAQPPHGDGAYSDFWRVSPRGLAFMLRGHAEDALSERFAPGAVFDLTLPVWRTGECLLHASRLAALLGVPDSLVLFRMKWDGLAGRALVSVTGRRWVHEGRVCRQPSVTSEEFVRADAITVDLPQMVQSITMPLYQAFGFFTPSSELINTELDRMRGRAP